MIESQRAPGYSFQAGCLWLQQSERRIPKKKQTKEGRLGVTKAMRRAVCVAMATIDQVEGMKVSELLDRSDFSPQVTLSLCPKQNRLLPRTHAENPELVHSSVPPQLQHLGKTSEASQNGPHRLTSRTGVKRARNEQISWNSSSQVRGKYFGKGSRSGFVLKNLGTAATLSFGFPDQVLHCSTKNENQPLWREANPRTFPSQGQNPFLGEEDSSQGPKRAPKRGVRSSHQLSSLWAWTLKAQALDALRFLHRSDLASQERGKI